MNISSAQNVLKALTEAPLRSYSEVTSGIGIASILKLPPKVGGVYAWYYTEQSSNPSPFFRRFALLYIGESQNLHDRIQEHCTSSRNSPMRQKLDTIIYGTRGFLEPANEEQLNMWMQENAFVCWVEEPKHKEVEKYIIETARPPLNYEYNPNFR